MYRVNFCSGKSTSVVSTLSDARSLISATYKVDHDGIYPRIETTDDSGKVMVAWDVCAPQGTMYAYVTEADTDNAASRPVDNVTRKEREVGRLIDRLNRALTEYYVRDNVKPGLHISWLGTEWYVAIHLYGKQAVPNGPSDRLQREVAFKAKGFELWNALLILGREWMGAVGHGSEIGKLQDTLK